MSWKMYKRFSRVLPCVQLSNYVCAKCTTFMDVSHKQAFVLSIDNMDSTQGICCYKIQYINRDKSLTVMILSREEILQIRK